MVEWISENSAWFWLIVGTLLLVGEMLIPGIYMLWIGVAAIMTALIVSLFSDMSFMWQALVFAALGLIFILVTRRYLKLNPLETDNSELNRRGARHLGKVYTLVDAIEDGTGRVKIGDTLWTVNGPDLPSGDRVRIVQVEGATLTVEAAPDS